MRFRCNGHKQNKGRIAEIKTVSTRRPEKCGLAKCNNLAAQVIFNSNETPPATK